MKRAYAKESLDLHEWEKTRKNLAKPPSSRNVKGGGKVEKNRVVGGHYEKGNTKSLVS